jgi:hypothetical protein
MRSSPSHTITSAEVKAWFGQRANARLSETQYRAVAKKLNMFRRPGDPVECRAEPSPDVDPYWDFRAATKSAKLLLDAMPAMIRHWQALTWAPETRDGHAATVALERALQTALPFIEWPFGEYRRTTGRKQPKPWHLPSVLVAKILAEAMVTSQCSPSLARSAVLVRVTAKALQCMGYKLTNVGTSGISAHLTRWDSRYGLIRHLKRR